MSIFRRNSTQEGAEPLKAYMQALKENNSSQFQARGTFQKGLLPQEARELSGI